MTLSILSEKRADGRLVNLGGKCSVPMEPGVSSVADK
jgi:hypothetical protein